MFLPAFRLVRRAETNNARTFTGTGIVLGCHKLRVLLVLTWQGELEATVVYKFDYLNKGGRKLYASVDPTEEIKSAFENTALWLATLHLGAHNLDVVADIFKHLGVIDA